MSKRLSHYTNPNTAKKRLRLLLALFFCALALPVYLLLQTVYAQLDNEAYFKLRNQAELLVQRSDQRLLEIITAEQERPIAEYSFFNVLENPLLQSSSVKFSPLSENPPRTAVPGLTGYFQINPDGGLTTPALPDLENNNNDSGLSATELVNRVALRDKLQSLLMSDSRDKQDREANRLEEAAGIAAKSKTAAAAKSGYRFDDALSASPLSRDTDMPRAVPKTRNEIKDQASEKLAKKTRALSDAQLQQLNIDAKRWQQKPNLTAESEANYAARKETVKLPSQSFGALFERRVQSPAPAVAEAKQEAVPTRQSKADEVTVGQKPIRIFSFESEVGPLQFIALNGEYWCFFRQVWRNNNRYIQGFIVDGREFFSVALQSMFGNAQTAAFSSVLLAHDGVLLKQFKLAPAQQEVLLYRTFLTAPLNHVEMIVNSGPAIAGAGSILIDGLAVMLAAVLLLGMWGFYRLGAGQIELVQRQRNFISAVSHELKTPLTSIRMYAEMLRAGWVSDAAKQKGYYDYIYFESERLSRLIANVLQLAKLDNHLESLQLTNIAPQALLQRIETKVAAQIEAVNFRLNIVHSAANINGAQVAVDEDAFFQIIINLVDNALKFSADAENKVIDIGLKILLRDREAVFFVRDYGPGVERKQMKKIFQLFYRPGNELTRAKPGTGIGLALVVQLAGKMRAKVDLLNRQPGAEFQVKLPLVKPYR